MNAERAWKAAEPPRRNALAATFMEGIVIRRATGTSGTFDPERVQIVPHPIDSPEPPTDCDWDDDFITAALQDNPTGPESRAVS